MRARRCRPGSRWCTAIALAAAALLAPPAVAVPVTFTVEVPHCTPLDATIYLRSNRLESATFIHDAMTALDATHHRVTVDVVIDRAQFEYKYSNTICDATACPGIEKDLTFTGSGSEVAPRTLGATVTAADDSVYVWRNAVARFDSNGQPNGLRSSPDQLVAFCAPYLSIRSVDGAIGLGIDAFDAEPVQLEFGPTTAYGQTLLGTGTHRNHFALPSATPGGTVYYRLTIAGRERFRSSLRALPAAGAAVRFAVLGDTQYTTADNRTDLEALIAQLLAFDPDFALHVGDMVNSGYVDPAWLPPEQARFGRFFSSLALFANRVPVNVVMGNHEEDAPYFWDVFDFPQPHAPALDHYSFRAGDALVIGLYTGRTAGYSVDGILDSQTAWLEGVLQAHASDGAVRWRIVFLHRGVHSGSNYHDDGWQFFEGGTAQRPSWRSLFEQHGIDLVFAGHNHAFALARSGGIHFVTQCSGAPLHDLIDPRPAEVIYAERSCSVGLVGTGALLTFAARRPDGSDIAEASFALCHEAADCSGLALSCDAGGSWRCLDRQCQASCGSLTDGASLDVAAVDAGARDRGTAVDVVGAEVVSDAHRPDAAPSDRAVSADHRGDAATPDRSLPDAMVAMDRRQPDGATRDRPGDAGRSDTGATVPPADCGCRSDAAASAGGTHPAAVLLLGVLALVRARHRRGQRSMS